MIMCDQFILVASVHNLGAIFDTGLTFIPHIQQTVEVANVQLHLICKAIKLFSHTDRIILVTALVQSCLDYCDGVLLGVPIKWSQKLQLVQN